MPKIFFKSHTGFTLIRSSAPRKDFPAEDPERPNVTQRRIFAIVQSFGRRPFNGNLRGQKNDESLKLDWQVHSTHFINEPASSRPTRCILLLLWTFRNLISLRHSLPQPSNFWRPNRGECNFSIPNTASRRPHPNTCLLAEKGDF